jgi:hypothetical protein
MSHGLHPDNCILDTALFQQKLYILIESCDGAHTPGIYDLHAMDIVGVEVVNIRRVISMPKDGMDQCPRGLPRYLVASADRLLMVEQKMELDTTLPIHLVVKQPLFLVFEAVDMSSDSRGRWRKTDTLKGRALFLSEGCSQSLPAAGRQCVGAQDDCIYFLNERSGNGERTGRLYSGIYNIRQGTMSPLTPEKGVAPDGPWTATWFFPDVG